MGRTGIQTRRGRLLAPTVVLLAGFLAVVACSGSSDDRGDSDPLVGGTSDTEASVPENEAGSDVEAASDDEAGESDGEGSDLETGAIEGSSDLEIRVHETLSELDAEVVDGATVVTLPATVLFDFDQHVLRPEAGQVLDDLAEAIVFFEDAPVEIQGHTDSRGSDQYNQDLSERRAASVVDYLAAQGVGRDRLTATGLGETQPVAPNENDDGSDNPDGRAQNRRVEVIIEGVDFEELGS